jgi:hypothetical protein
MITIPTIRTCGHVVNFDVQLGGYNKGDLILFLDA